MAAALPHARHSANLMPRAHGWCIVTGTQCRPGFSCQSPRPALLPPGARGYRLSRLRIAASRSSASRR